MIILFYLFGCIAIISTIFVICSTNPIHALLFLIASLLSISCDLFCLRAPLAGAIEVIIYAGAIMVLFIFTIMMLNINTSDPLFHKPVPQFLSIKNMFGVLLLMINLLMIFLYCILQVNNCYINVLQSTISIKKISVTLFDTYGLIIEIASFLLLSALIVVVHIAQEHNNVFNNFVSLRNHQNNT